MLCCLELNIDVDDLIGENEVLVVAFDPRRLRSVLYLADTDELQHKSWVDSGRVFVVDLSGKGHQITQSGALN